MKKIQLAAALLAAPALSVSAAETDLHLSGTVAFSASHFSADSGDISAVKNNASRIGLFGAVEEGGLRAFIAYERGFDGFNAGEAPDDSQDAVRAFFGGVSGRFGTLIAGRTKSDWRLSSEAVDPFYNTSVIGFTGGFARGGANYGLSNLSNGFSDNAVIFRSNDYAGLRFNAGVYVNDNNESTGNDEHDYGVGAAWHGGDLLAEGDALEVGVQFLDINNTAVSGVPFDPAASVGGSPGVSTNTRLHASYAHGDTWSLGLSVENVDVEAENDARLYSYASATVGLSPKTRLAVGVGYLDFADGSPDIDGLGYTFGVFHTLVENLRTYAAVRVVDYDQVRANGDSDTTVFAVGASYSFELDLD